MFDRSVTRLKLKNNQDIRYISQLKSHWPNQGTAQFNTLILRYCEEFVVDQYSSTVINQHEHNNIQHLCALQKITSALDVLLHGSLDDGFPGDLPASCI